MSRIADDSAAPGDSPRSSIPWRRVTLAGGSLLVALVTVFLVRQHTAWPREAAWMVGIFLVAALWWVTEALPPFATSLAVIGMQIILLSNPGGWQGFGFEHGDSPKYTTIIAAAADPVILLFFGGFLLAQAASKEGVDQAMAGLIIRPFGGGPRRVLLGIMAATALFSMWISNTATAAMMITLAVPMLAQMPAGERFRKAIVLGIAFAANIGGIGTPIGTPPNAVAVGFLRNAGVNVGFLQWMLVAVPLMLGMLVFSWFLLSTLFRPVTQGLILRTERVALTPRAKFVVVIFAITAALWLTEPLHKLPAAVVALLPAIAFTATGLLGRDDVNGLEWNILILIAGGISLGTGISATGLDRIAVAWIAGDGATFGFAMVAALTIVTVVLGTFMSHTAAANLVLPIGISLATALRTDHGAVIEVAVAIALGASLAMSLPITTPPNAIVFARGETTTRDMAISGSIIAAVGVTLVVLGSGFAVRFWGLGQ